MRVLAFVLAALTMIGAFLLGAQTARAATCGSLSAFAGAEDCASFSGGSGGNVTADLLNDQSAFGFTGWTSLGKIDVGGADGDAPFALDVEGDGRSGGWALSGGLIFDPEAVYAFALKGGPANVVYLLDGLTLGGAWTTAGLPTVGRGASAVGRGRGPDRGGEAPALSNISLFGTARLNAPPAEAPAPVPLPAAGWLLAGGVAALALLRRRARA